MYDVYGTLHKAYTHWPNHVTNPPQTTEFQMQPRTAVPAQPDRFLGDVYKRTLGIGCVVTQILVVTQFSADSQ